MKGKRSYPRSSRIADLIKEEVATLFIYSVNDPRLHGISITDVKMTEDLKVAKIYYVCSNKEDTDATNKGLKSVQGWVRKEISKKLNMRYTPELEFHYDDVFENGMKIDKIFKDIEHGSDK
jgi:ribosome-binding factor A